MSGIWLVVNSASGSYDPAMVKAVKAAFRAGGMPVSRDIVIPRDRLPTAEEAQAKAPALIAIFTGDGTASAAVESLAGWDGPLLVLPGGTMNLLSHKLHGEAEAPDIVADALRQGLRTVRLNRAEGCGRHSLVGIIAGPTAAWGEVREDLRHADVASLAKSVPEALTKTLKGDMVAVAGAPGRYQAIFIEPQADALAATGIRAANLAELAQHGVAWLNRDFLGGPTEPLMRAGSVTVTGGDSAPALLVDGERAKGRTPCTFVLQPCSIAFVTTRKQP